MIVQFIGTIHDRAVSGKVGYQGARMGHFPLAYAYDPTSGTGPADEDAPLWRDPPKQFAPVLAALKELEQQTGTMRGCHVELPLEPAPITVEPHGRPLRRW